MFDPLRECVCGEFILPLDRHYGYFLFTIAGSFYNVPRYFLNISSENEKRGLAPLKNQRNQPSNDCFGGSNPPGIYMASMKIE